MRDVGDLGLGCRGAAEHGGDFRILTIQHKNVAFTHVIQSGSTGKWVKISDQGTGIGDPALENAFG